MPLPLTRPKTLYFDEFQKKQNCTKFFPVNKNCPLNEILYPHLKVPLKLWTSFSQNCFKVGVQGLWLIEVFFTPINIFHFINYWMPKCSLEEVAILFKNNSLLIPSPRLCFVNDFYSFISNDPVQRHRGHRKTCF